MTKNYHKKTNCEICEKSIQLYVEVIGGEKKDSITVSDEGVFFNAGSEKAWFCNECWVLVYPKGLK